MKRKDIIAVIDHLINSGKLDNEQIKQLEQVKIEVQKINHLKEAANFIAEAIRIVLNNI